MEDSLMLLQWALTIHEQWLIFKERNELVVKGSRLVSC